MTRVQTANAPIVAGVQRIAQLARDNVSTIGTGARFGEPQRVAVAMRYADIVGEFEVLNATEKQLRSQGKLALPRPAVQQAIKGERLLHDMFREFARYEKRDDQAAARQDIKALAERFATHMEASQRSLEGALQTLGAKPRFALADSASTASTASSTSSSSSSSSTPQSDVAWVDGQPLNSLGYTPRGYGRSAGPDDAYDPLYSSSRSSGYSYSGPDGTSDSSVFLG